MSSDIEDTQSIKIRIPGKGIAYILVALLSGGGGALLTDVVKPPRPNPYTSLDGRRDRAEMLGLHETQQAQINALSERLHRIELIDQKLQGAIEHVHEALDDHMSKKRPH